MHTTHWQAGRTDEAIGLLERVVADRERLMGDEHPDTLTARQKLSGWRSAEGSPDQSPH
jgi:Iap family predicted aminopeptidase